MTGSTRRFLVAACVMGALGIVGSAPAAPAAPTCRPTLSEGAGPFELNRAVAPVRSRIGQGHVLTVRVLRFPGCAPVRGVGVEVWQESPGGRYDRRGHASGTTNRAGTFRFQGPVPPSEFGRPHIHIRVSGGPYEEVVTTYEVRRGTRQGRITIVLMSGL